MFGGLFDFFKGGFDGFGNNVAQGWEQMQSAAQGLPAFNPADQQMGGLPQSNMFDQGLVNASQGLDDLTRGSSQAANPLMPSDMVTGRGVPNVDGSFNPQMSPNYNGNPAEMVQNVGNSSTLVDDPYKATGIDWNAMGQVKLPEQAPPPKMPTPSPIMSRGRNGEAPAMPNLGALQMFNRAAMPTSGTGVPPWVQQMMVGRQ